MRIDHFEVLDSTNTQAHRLGSSGVCEPCWIYTDRQTNGRGRGGRRWYSPAGNLMASLYWPNSMLLTVAAQFSFAVGLAVYDMAAAVRGTRAGLSLKWPNDLLLDGAKCAGILLETGGVEGDMARFLVMGVGANLVAAPEDTPYPSCTLLAADSKSATPAEALVFLNSAFTHWQNTFTLSGFSKISEAWMSRAHAHGEMLTVRLCAGANSAVQHGRYLGLDVQGALMLADAEGRMYKIYAGDVFFDGMDTHGNDG